ncbi:MAG: alpha/beta fold hydrolase [Chloroflexota bacterium]
MQSTEGSVRAGGTELFYWSIGSGLPILVLGGTALGHWYLRPAMDRLADGHRVIYPDQRGSGRSALGDAPGLSIDRSIADLVSVLDDLGVDQAAVLGHSIGGNIAMLFAAAHPDRVSRLVAAMPGPPFDSAGMAWEQLEAAMTALRTPADDEGMASIQQSEAFTRREPAGVEAYIRNMYLPFFTDRATATTIPYAITAHGAATAVEQEGMLFGQLDTAAALASLSMIKCPTLVLSADLDPIPESFAERLADAIPGAVHQRLTGAGHFAFLEQPDAFFGAVESFLAANP